MTRAQQPVDLWHACFKFAVCEQHGGVAETCGGVGGRYLNGALQQTLRFGPARFSDEDVRAQLQHERTLRLRVQQRVGKDLGLRELVPRERVFDFGEYVGSRRAFMSLAVGREQQTPQRIPRFLSADFEVERALERLEGTRTLALAREDLPESAPRKFQLRLRLRQRIQYVECFAPLA